MSIHNVIADTIVHIVQGGPNFVLCKNQLNTIYLQHSESIQEI